MVITPAKIKTEAASADVKSIPAFTMAGRFSGKNQKLQQHFPGRILEKMELNGF